MKKLLTIALCAALISSIPADACTNVIITRGASTDGASIVPYAADAHVLYGER